VLHHVRRQEQTLPPTRKAPSPLSPKCMPSNTSQDEFEMANSAFSSSDPFSDRFRLADHQPLPYAGYEPSAATTAPSVTEGPLLPAPAITDYKRCGCCCGRDRRHGRRLYCGCTKPVAAIWGVIILLGMVGGIWGFIIMIRSGNLVKGLPPDVYSEPS